MAGRLPVLGRAWRNSGGGRFLFRGGDILPLAICVGGVIGRLANASTGGVAREADLACEVIRGGGCRSGGGWAIGAEMVSFKEGLTS